MCEVPKRKLFPRRIFLKIKNRRERSKAVFKEAAQPSESSAKPHDSKYRKLKRYFLPLRYLIDLLSANEEKSAVPNC